MNAQPTSSTAPVRRRRRSGREVTSAAVREAKDIMREIASGKRTPKTLDEMLAEIAAL